MPRRYLIAALAALAAAPTASASVVPGEAVVRFRAGSDAVAREQVRAGVRAVDAGSAGTPGARLLRFPGDRPLRTVLAALRARPEVSAATANPVARTAAGFFNPNDTGRGQPGDWSLQQWNFLPFPGMNAPEGWTHAIAAGREGGRGVTIAVLDTGVAYKTKGGFRRSPDLLRTRIRSGYDFVSDDKEPFDENGHGTHVASTIAESTNNEVGLTGIAYGATVMPIRVLDEEGRGSAVRIARGVRFAAEKGADIINMSLEFPADDVRRASQVPELARAVKFAIRKGALVVAASGNDGVAKISYPAALPNVVSVGGTTERGCIALYSNHAAGLDIVAPGGGTDAPDALNPSCREDLFDGRDIIQVTFTSSPRRFGTPSGYLGTSMAASHVSGVAALILATGTAGEDPSPRELQRKLKLTAHDLGEPGADNRYGAGILDAGAATRPVPIAGSG